MQTHSVCFLQYTFLSSKSKADSGNNSEACAPVSHYHQKYRIMHVPRLKSKNTAVTGDTAVKESGKDRNVRNQAADFLRRRARYATPPPIRRDARTPGSGWPLGAAVSES